MQKLFVLLTFFLILSCSIPDSNSRLSGTLEKQEVTSYQYGSHVLVSDTTFYAIQSERVPLDSFLNKKVIVWGHLKDGYPVDGGPDLIEVDSVRLAD